MFFNELIYLIIDLFLHFLSVDPLHTFRTHKKNLP